MPPVNFSRRTALYRLFNAEGDLLYIGISADPDNRMNGHRYSKAWWPEVAEKTFQWFDDRASARAAELEAIATEGARYNRDGSPSYSKKITLPPRTVNVAGLHNSAAAIMERVRFFGEITYVSRRNVRVASIVSVEVGELVDEIGMDEAAQILRASRS